MCRESHHPRERTGHASKRLEADALLFAGYYNYHPGAHTDQGAEKGVELIADALNRTLTPSLQDKPFILETPNNNAGYIREIHTVNEWMKES